MRSRSGSAANQISISRGSPLRRPMVSRSQTGRRARSSSAIRQPVHRLSLRCRVNGPRQQPPQLAEGLGFPRPSQRERFERLEDTLQIAHRMWQGERAPRRTSGATTTGRRASSTCPSPSAGRGSRSSSVAAARRGPFGSSPSTLTPQTCSAGRSASTRSWPALRGCRARDFAEIERTNLRARQPVRPQRMGPGAGVDGSDRRSLRPAGRGGRPARHHQHRRRARPGCDRASRARRAAPASRATDPRAVASGAGP